MTSEQKMVKESFFNLRNKLIKSFEKINVARSSELVALAYEKGFFDEYNQNVDNVEEILLSGLLYTCMYNGCAITPEEIEKLKSYILENK